MKTASIEQQEIDKIDQFVNSQRPTVIVQGLGFVGTAMTAALVIARQGSRPHYNVIGVDLAQENSLAKIKMVNQGQSPIKAVDSTLDQTYAQGIAQGNLMATSSAYAYTKADIVVIDIHLDIKKSSLGDVHKPEFDYDTFKSALQTVADNIRPGTLIVLETTVPPGTTQKIVEPLFRETFLRRKLDLNELYLCYSFERVMPGANYLNSVVNFYRVYAGINLASNQKAKIFFESFINTKDFPLSQLHSTTACEMAKVLENSFRAMNIAFIQEWTEFADQSGVNLFEVIEAIRKRPTHSNIMLPGFGVGGYCLTKDPLLADWASQNFFDCENRLTMSRQAVAINDLMPQYTFDRLKEAVGEVKGQTVLVLGVSYLEGVGDTRYSPTQYFYDLCQKNGMNVLVHDPLVSHWHEKNLKITTDITSFESQKIDAVVFAVRHKEYSYNASKIMKLFPQVKVIVDANNMLNEVIKEELLNNGIKLVGVGKGHWNKG